MVSPPYQLLKMAKKKTSAAPEPGASAQTDDQTAENALETQSIKFLRSHPSYAYWPGDTADLTAEHVTLLVDGGFAELVAEPAADTDTED
jgi:hypothetical protein